MGSLIDVKSAQNRKSFGGDNALLKRALQQTFFVSACTLGCLQGRVSAIQVYPAQDTFTSAAASQVGVNFNSGNTLGVLSVDGRPANLRKTWVEFDLKSALPEGLVWSEVAKATFTVYVTSVQHPGVVRIEAAHAAWNEAGLTELTAPQSGNDSSGAVYARATIIEAARFVSFDITELVRDWLDGAVANNGLVLVPSDSSVRFAMDSKEGTTTSHPAFLDITLANGTPGGAWLSGSGVPATELGGVGDFYMDLQSSAFYGPKNTTGWGKAVSLKGSTGAQGPLGLSGASWWSGNTVPGVALGKTGDFYINQSSSRYYGPKTASGWGGGFLLKGAAGPAGPMGPQGLRGESGSPGPAGALGLTGEQGIPGDTGPKGDTGAPGQEGPVGPAGPQGSSGVGALWLTGRGEPGADLGADGDLYFDLDASAIYGPKRDSSWLLASVIKGAPGIAGPVGAQGVRGEAGARGEPGASGRDGLAGQAGPAGARGLSGAQGPAGEGGPQGTEGPQGRDGVAGTNGSGVLSGYGEPLPEVGEIGDHYIDRIRLMYYGPKTNTGWDAGVPLKGEAGINGRNGTYWIVGLGQPLNLYGELGDLYLDIQSGELWGPKTESGWPDSMLLSIIGPQGASGRVGGAGLPTHIEPLGDISMGIFTVKAEQ